MELNEFEAYLESAPQEIRVKGEAWLAAFGMQSANSKTPAPYLLDLARKEMDGEISMDEVGQLIKEYEENKSEMEEAVPQTNLSTKANSAASDSQEKGKSPHILPRINSRIALLVMILGKKQLSAVELTSRIGLKDRNSFLMNYLDPAIASGFVYYLYPESPKHRKQRYLLTVKGMMFYEKMI